MAKIWYKTYLTNCKSFKYIIKNMKNKLRLHNVFLRNLFLLKLAIITRVKARSTDSITFKKKSSYICFRLLNFKMKIISNAVSRNNRRIYH